MARACARIAAVNTRSPARRCLACAARGAGARFPNESPVNRDQGPSFRTVSLIIVARADAVETREKLRLAGADRVVTPYSIGGRRMALSAVRPLTADFLYDILDPSRIGPRLAEIAVVTESRYAGMQVADFAAAHALQVLAVSKKNGQILFSPAAEVVLESGDRVEVAGDDEQQQHLISDV